SRAPRAARGVARRAAALRDGGHRAARGTLSRRVERLSGGRAHRHRAGRRRARGRRRASARHRARPRRAERRARAPARFRRPSMSITSRLDVQGGNPDGDRGARRGPAVVRGDEAMQGIVEEARAADGPRPARETRQDFRRAHLALFRPRARALAGVFACAAAAIVAAEPGAIAVASAAALLLLSRVPERGPAAARWTAASGGALALAAWVRLASESARLFGSDLDRSARALELARLEGAQRAVWMVALAGVLAIALAGLWRGVRAWP